MGCEWKTKDGKRIRVSSVSAPVQVSMLGSFSLGSMMLKLGILKVAASPAFSYEDLKDATLRLWLDQEKGYIVESRIRPGAPPQYHFISQQDATKLEAERPDPEFIARMFHVAEPVYN